MDGRLFVTGDLHGSSGSYRFSHSGIFQDGKPQKGDVVLVAGDWSMPFIDPEIDDKALNEFCKFPWTFAFIDGNHENFPKLYSYPEEERFGGPVGVLRPNIFHLKRRGHVYKIFGKTIWCFGGAMSHDKECRVENISWWPQEEATELEMSYGLEQLEKYKNVDLFLTHECPFSLSELNPRLFRSQSLPRETYVSQGHEIKPSATGRYLDKAAKCGSAGLWVFGHHHFDENITNCDPYPNRKFRAIYKDIIMIK